MILHCFLMCSASQISIPGHYIKHSIAILKNTCVVFHFTVFVIYHAPVSMLSAGVKVINQNRPYLQGYYSLGKWTKNYDKILEELCLSKLFLQPQPLFRHCSGHGEEDSE